MNASSMVSSVELLSFTEHPSERMEAENHQTFLCEFSLELHVELVGLMKKIGRFSSSEGNTGGSASAQLCSEHIDTGFKLFQLF